MIKVNEKVPTYKIVCFQNRFTTEVGIELINWYMQGEKSNSTYRKSIGLDFLVKEFSIKNIIVKAAFWRLSGQKSFGFMRGSFYKGGHASIIIFTLLNLEQGKQYVQARLEEVRNYIGNVPVLVIAVDLDKIQMNNIKSNPIRNEIKSYVKNKGGLYFETPSDSIEILGTGIEKLIEQVLEKNTREELNFIDTQELSSIKEIEKDIGRPIPELDIEKEELFGYKVENNHIIELYLQGLGLKTLSDKIGYLEQLKILDLKFNQLVQLPNSISNLKSLVLLNLTNNNFSTIPAHLWCLENLKLIELKDNPWKGKSKEFFDKSPNVIRDFCRRRANIHIFMSHAVVDYEKFKIKEIADYLSNQEEIYKAYYCEEDLKGNIDEFMDTIIPKCQLLLFFGSKKSVFESLDCQHELHLARNHSIQIIPIKGKDVRWEELENVGLNRELGLDFNLHDQNNFYQELYRFLLDFKRKIDLMNQDRGKIDKLILEILTSMEDYLKSDDIIFKLKNNFKRIEKLREKFKNRKIPIKPFLKKLLHIIS